MRMIHWSKLLIHTLLTYQIRRNNDKLSTSKSYPYLSKTGWIICRCFVTKVKWLFVYVVVNRAAKRANLSRQPIFCLHQSLFLYVKNSYALNEIILLQFYRFQENCQNISPIWRIGSIEIHWRLRLQPILRLKWSSRMLKL